MRSDPNSILLEGIIPAPPEVTDNLNGVSIVTFTLKTTRYTGTLKETNHFEVDAEFSTVAKFNPPLVKGDRLRIVGRLSFRGIPIVFADHIERSPSCR